jgi:signal transduction histidine kinase
MAAERAAEAERESERREREAAANERVRLARELHDVVSHSLSVISVHAGAARSVIDAPERLSASLLSIETVSREAWAEMRQFLDLVGRDPEAAAGPPRSGLAHLEELVERFEAAGLPVDLEVAGEAVPLPAEADLCAYRVVQESLTNALRHGDQSQARVSIRYGDPGVEVEVASSPAAGTNGGAPVPGPHHGLAGMRERVRLTGGELQVENGGGRFVVRARLPLPAAP